MDPLNYTLSSRELEQRRNTYFGKEFDLLVMGRLFRFPTADNGFYKDRGIILWSEQTKQTSKQATTEQRNNHSSFRHRAAFQKKLSKLSCFHKITSYRVLCDCAGWVCLMSILTAVSTHTFLKGLQ